MKRIFYDFLATFLMILAFKGPITQKKYALVIGNGTYTGSNMSKLANPVNDANDMAAALQEPGFTVDKLLDASLEQMESSIMQLKTAFLLQTKPRALIPSPHIERLLSPRMR
jgi:hypothetical protein